jgi:hypothetical protein
MENKQLQDNYVTPSEAIAANRVMDCIFRLLEQFEHEKGRPNPFTNNPPLPPSCSHLGTWASVRALRSAFVRLREDLDKHKDALDEQVPYGELIKGVAAAECQAYRSDLEKNGRSSPGSDRSG